MKKQLFTLALSAMLLAPATAALAEQNAGGLFVRGNIGQSNYRISGQQFSSTTDTGWGLGLGYRWAAASGNWGLDGGYVDLGHASANSNYLRNAYGVNASLGGKAASHGWSLGANYLYQFNSNWNVQARTGLVFTRTHLNLHATGPSGYTFSSRQTSSDTSAYVGAGIGYDFSRNFGLNLSYDFYRINSFGGHDHAGLLSAGAEYRF